MVGSTEPAPRMRQGRAPVQGPFQVGQACRPVDAGAAAVAEEAASDVDHAEHGADEHQPDDGEHVDRPEHRVDEGEDEHEPDRSEADRRRQGLEESVQPGARPIGSSRSAGGGATDPDETSPVPEFRAPGDDGRNRR